MALKMEVKAEMLDVVEIRKAPDRIAILVAQEMRRHAKRYRKEFIKTQLKGGAGIKFDSGGINKMVRSKLIGGRITSFMKGRKDIDALKIVSKVSAFLAPFVVGGTIRKNTPIRFKSLGNQLLLRTPNEIKAVVKKSKIKTTKKQVKARPKIAIAPTLEFRTIWNVMEPKLIERIDKAVERALNKSFALNKRVA